MAFALIISLVQKLCCSTSADQSGPSQQQQQQQQGGQYPQQQNQGDYYNNQQQAYPPQQQPHGAWNGQNQNLHQQNQNQNHNQNHNNYQNAGGHGGGGGGHQNQQQHGQGSQGGYKPQQQHSSGGYIGGQPTGPNHNQNTDMLHATNAHYTSLRNSARQAGDRSHQLFAQSQAAYQSGDGASAHQLSEQGKQAQAEKERLNKEADDWIYQQNNQEAPQGTIDLHGLYVKEAIERTDEAIAAAQRSGQDELRIIVGKGIHSPDHVAKIKPAVEDLMRKYNLAAHLDPQNSGVLIVDLNGRAENGRTRDAGQLVNEMQGGNDGNCTIM